MAVTTFGACRDEEIALVEATTPTSESALLFRAHLAQDDFRTWAQEQPNAATRRFDVRDLFEYDEPININNERALYGRHEVVIAYRNDFRYGADRRRDMFDVIHEDRRKIDEAIGPTAYSSLTNHRNWHEGDWFSVEVGEAVTFLVLVYRHFFHEDAPT